MVLTKLLLTILLCSVLTFVILLYVFLGEWMNSSAGMAFSPHVITVEAGEVVIFFYFIRDLAFDALLCLVFPFSLFYILNIKALRPICI